MCKDAGHESRRWGIGVKRIVVLSDGTGNSSAKLFKTNVWRLYQALDLAQQGDVPQVAYYDDGVGTSSFRPLALLGGAFGYGLKRNVLHLYDFLCRTWEPGDEIYAFGFSRGAFTVRILAGLVLDQGLLTACPDRALAGYSRDAYRAYRWRFNATGGLVAPLRKLRDAAVRVWRAACRQAQYAQLEPAKVPAIEFIGVWDTVAAYGTPLAELTRGIDEWVWPLSMPDHHLKHRVKAARQALALDDERETFHPVLWDEVAEQAMADRGEVAPGRIKQVWFAGMHADVGGGYPDDSLSYEPLAWMIQEAEKAGLRFRPEALQLLALEASRSAPIHDSRRGLGGYYRYQPRKIAARLAVPDPASLLMQNPDPAARARLTSVQVHQSVFDRIASGPGRYAPLVLPRDYAVVQRDSAVTARPESAAQAAARCHGQERVWNDVWRKRVAYFASVGVSLLLAAAPLWGSAAACEGPQCLLSPVIQGIGLVLPGFASYWTGAFARNPGTSAVLAGALALLLLRGASLERRIHDGMRALWAPIWTPRQRPAGSAPARVWSDPGIAWLRTRYAYQRAFQILKWTVAPNLFGPVILAALVVLAGGLPLLGAYRAQLALAERSGAFCGAAPGAASQAAPGGERLFRTDAVCWDTGTDLERGRAYEIRMRVVDPWEDGATPASPEGLEPGRLPWGFGYLALPVRRSLGGGWFQPFLTIRPGGKPGPSQGLDIHFAGSAYVATFEAAATGRAYLWVNDVALDRQGVTGRFYADHHGTASVRIVPAGPPAAYGRGR